MGLNVKECDPTSESKPWVTKGNKVRISYLMDVVLPDLVETISNKVTTLSKHIGVSFNNKKVMEGDAEDLLERQTYREKIEMLVELIEAAVSDLKGISANVGQVNQDPNPDPKSLKDPEDPLEMTTVDDLLIEFDQNCLDDVITPGTPDCIQTDEIQTFDQDCQDRLGTHDKSDCDLPDQRYKDKSSATTYEDQNDFNLHEEELSCPQPESDAPTLSQPEELCDSLDDVMTKGFPQIIHSGETQAIDQDLPEKLGSAKKSKCDLPEKRSSGKTNAASDEDLNYLNLHEKELPCQQLELAAPTLLNPEDQHANPSTQDKQQELEANLGSQYESNLNMPREHVPSLQLESDASKLAITNGSQKHKCTTCQKTYSSDSALRQHTRIHNGEKPYACTFCDAKFTQMGQKKSHENSHTGVKPYECEFCDMRFAKSTHLTSHEIKHTGGEPLGCRHCNKTFPSSIKRRIHERDHTDEKHKCATCHKTYSSGSALKKHTRIHNGEKPYACSICDAKFTQMGQKKSHENSHTGVKPYECEFCDMRFARSAHLITHEIKHTGGEPLGCRHCNETFPSSFKRRIHEREHTGEKPFACTFKSETLEQLCTATFSKILALRFHERKHKFMSAKKYDLPEQSSNGKTNATTNEGKNDLNLDGEQLPSQKLESVSPTLLNPEKQLFNPSDDKQHEELEENLGSQYENNLNMPGEHVSSLQLELDASKLANTNGSQTHKCKTCQKTYSSISALRQHTRIHTGEKPFACSICDARFTQMGQKKKHENFHTGAKPRIHSGEKPFSCTLCGAGFTRLYSKMTHERTHTGEKPYACKLCDMKFTRCDNLKNHEGTHTDEKPYSCSHCIAQFATYRNLKRHEKTHTVGPFACTTCNTQFIWRKYLLRHKKVCNGEHSNKCKGLDEKENKSENNLEGSKHECKTCHKTYSSDSVLRQHVRIHTGEKPYACSICDARFTQLVQKKNHENSHTGEKPYGCEFCDMKFTRGSARLRHETLRHTGGKPLSCTHCDKKFPSSIKRKIHEREHTGEKPFACTHKSGTPGKDNIYKICTAKFSSITALRLHERNHKD